MKKKKKKKITDGLNSVLANIENARSSLNGTPAHEMRLSEASSSIDHLITAVTELTAVVLELHDKR